MNARYALLALTLLGVQGCDTLPLQASAGPLASAARAPVVDHLARAQALEQQHQGVQAEGEYRAVLAAQPESREAASGLASVLGQTGRLVEAQRLLEALVARYPQDAGLCNNLGYAHYLQGHYAQAVDLLLRAQQLDPANLRTQNNLKLAQAALLHAVRPVEPASLLDDGQTVVGTAQTAVAPVVVAVQSAPEPETPPAPCPPLALTAARRLAAGAPRTLVVTRQGPPALSVARHAHGLRLALILGSAGAAGTRTTASAALATGRSTLTAALRLQLARVFPAAEPRTWMLGRTDARNAGAAVRRPRVAGNAQPG